jgi:competence protein ComEC
MLRHVGREHPLVVVFAGMGSAICLGQGDAYGCGFCLFMLVLLLTGDRAAHALGGIALGALAAIMAPGWSTLADGDHHISGRIQEAFHARGTFRMVVEDVRLDHQRVRGSALVSVYERPPRIVPGDTVSCPLRVKAPRGFGNEGEFDYREHLLGQGIVLAGSVRDGNTLAVTPCGDRAGFRQRLSVALDRRARPEAELFKAMFVGDRSGITDSLRDRFCSLGIVHLIAISGLHIGTAMMAGYVLAFGLLRLLPVVSLRLDTPLVARFAGIAAAVGYTAFVGPATPTLRACIMAVSCGAGLMFMRKPDVLDELALAGIVICTLWPGSPHSASFLLSFSAVLGIVGVLARTATSPPWFRFGAVSVAAGVFTMPILVYLFGFVSLRGFVANVVIVPFFSLVVMPLSLAGMAAFPLWSGLSDLFFSLCMDALQLIVQACDVFGSIHPVKRPWIIWVYLCHTGFILAFWARRSRWRTWALTLIGTALVGLPLAQSHLIAAGPLRFDFISVGQGDCSLVTLGRHAVLVDAGPEHAGFDAGRQVVAPHLLRRGVNALDLMVITHWHPDHSGGALFILERFRVGEVWINSVQEKNPHFQEVIRITKEKSIPVSFVCLGDSSRYGSLTAEVLNPRVRLDSCEGRLDQNLQSIILKLGDKDVKGLFMGDADLFGELALVHLCRDIEAKVLKVAHHGGAKSCLAPFLEAVRPELAVISCGQGNRYGDPSEEALTRLRDHGAVVCRTDLHGEVMIAFPGGERYVKFGRTAADNQ